ENVAGDDFRGGLDALTQELGPPRQAAYTNPQGFQAFEQPAANIAGSSGEQYETFGHVCPCFLENCRITAGRGSPGTIETRPGRARPGSSWVEEPGQERAVSGRQEDAVDHVDDAVTR